MKTPNKFYRKNRNTLVGQAYRVFRRRSLKSAFGLDVAARDAADNFNLEPCRHAYQLVMQTLSGWKKSYRGPSLSAMFKMIARSKVRPVIHSPRPEPD